MIIVVSTERAPRAVGPYAQAIKAGGLIWVSGQVALDPASGALVGESVAEQTRKAMENLRNVLAAAGTTMKQVVRCTVYLTDLSSFEEMNQAYEGFFEPPYPARVCVEVSGLPKGASVEVDAVALQV